MASFTTEIGVDKFLLVTQSITQDIVPIFVFPDSFNPSRQATESQLESTHVSDASDKSVDYVGEVAREGRGGLLYWS